MQAKRICGPEEGKGKQVLIQRREDMEEKPSHPKPSLDDTFVVTRSVRDLPPAHYTFKIESYSLLTQLLQKSGVEKYESSEFEAGGYKWKLLIYPSGMKKKGVNGHISLYLAMSDSSTNTLPLGWEANVIFKFLVFDHIQDKYSTFEVGRVSRFHAWKTEIGILRLLPLSTFKDPSNGYLVDDCCVFGAEVFVVKFEGRGKGEKLSMINEPDNGTFSWKLDKFSGLTKGLNSSEFTIAGFFWTLKLDPIVNLPGIGQCLSLYLRLSDFSKLRSGGKLYAEYMLSIKDQVHGKHYERTCSKWFNASLSCLGFDNFISLSDLKCEKKDFIVKDTLIAEVKITFISIVNSFA